MTTTVTELTAAANFLIASPDYGKIINDLTYVIESWETNPMVYDHASDKAVLNAAIDLGLANRNAFEGLLKLVEGKRRELPHVKRNNYQRELMRERRQRIAKAVALREAEYGPMTTPRKREYAKQVQQRWANEREEFLRSRGGNASWQERNALIAQFWEGIDNRLTVNLRKAGAVAA